MTEGTKQVKTYAERVADGQKLVQLWLDKDKWELIRRAADSVQEPITTWIRRAVYTSLRKWELPVPKEDSKLYEKCSVCKRYHNKNEHFHSEE